MARLERARSLLISLLALEIAKEGTSGYRQRLTAMRDSCWPSSLRAKTRRVMKTCPIFGSMPAQNTAPS